MITRGLARNTHSRFESTVHLMSNTRTAAERRFNADYYDRWYDDADTRAYIASKAARFVLSYVDHMDARVSTVLDLGCGLGHWKHALLQQARNIRYTGVEFSSYLCSKFGWERGDVRTYSPGRNFDLVVCQGVLQYLSDEDCERAIDNLGALSKRFMYLEVLTAADAREVCAPEGTDFDVFVRQANWYARRLERDFVNLGGGLYAKPGMRQHFYELWRTGG
jgi:SAM-dependent methyltransferase